MNNCILKAVKKISKKAKEFEIDEKLDELKELLSEHGLYPKEEKKTNPVVVILAVVGAVAAVAAIAYGVYYFLMPEDSEYFEDFDEDDYETLDEDLEGDE